MNLENEPISFSFTACRRWLVSINVGSCVDEFSQIHWLRFGNFEPLSSIIGAATTAARRKAEQFSITSPIQLALSYHSLTSGFSTVQYTAAGFGIVKLLRFR
ncbi:hypothetical protein T02_3725 [Trichinella nativa]|uniref:Uncharacterized protein n=1 Tax=Trichinella nativa TaxID=6335 RepID=A0A0V1L690_9BILA|nr:hypothetical protein T02_3725 [Trichinella nativa]